MAQEAIQMLIIAATSLPGSGPLAMKRIFNEFNGCYLPIPQTAAENSETLLLMGRVTVLVNKLSAPVPTCASVPSGNTPLISAENPPDACIVGVCIAASTIATALTAMFGTYFASAEAMSPAPSCKPPVMALR